MPNDDLQQPIDWLGAARLAIVTHNIAYAIATQSERPAWKAGDFFGDRFPGERDAWRLTPAPLSREKQRARFEGPLLS